MSQPKREQTEKKFEMQLEEEQNLSRLHRQYDILDRSAGGEQGLTLAKQQKVLHILKKEQRNVLTDVGVATSYGKVRENGQTLKNLQKLLGNCDSYDGLIKRKKAHIKEVGVMVKTMEKKVMDAEKHCITEHDAQERVLVGRKTVENLENKLEVQVRQFCTICSDNSRLREEINHLLIERDKFNKIWEKLIGNLNRGKRFMLDLIEQATLAYDQREEWVSKLQILRQKAHSDLLLHVSEMRIIQKKIDHCTKLKEFMATKDQKRIMRDYEAKEQLKRQQRRESMEKLLTKYKEIINNIQEFSGESDMVEVARQFILQENENFSLFQYVNELNKEIEILNDALFNLHLKIDENKTLNDLRVEQQRTALVDLDEQVQKATEEATAAEKEFAEVNQKIDTIMKGIAVLFNQFGCSKDPLIELLGNNEEITYYNVLLYLNILETKIQECLINVFSREKRALESRKINFNQMLIQPIKNIPRIFHIEEIISTNPCPLCVEHEMVSDVIDDLQYVLHKNEIQGKLKDRLRLEDGLDRLHNVSLCNLPKSREIIQKRYH